MEYNPTDLYSTWQTNTEWKQAFLFNTARELSKTGSLGAHEHMFHILAVCFNSDDAHELYCALQLSLRPDYEWKGHFLRLFPMISEAELPPPIVDEEAERRFAEEQRDLAIAPDPGMSEEDIPF
jgi:hypothetical protein